MTKTIKPAAIKSKVVVQAQTDSAGVETVSADGKQVTVVVFGQQKVTNTALSAPRIDPFRVRATMDLVAGHWLVSQVRPDLIAPASTVPDLARGARNIAPERPKRLTRPVSRGTLLRAPLVRRAWSGGRVR